MNAAAVLLVLAGAGQTQYAEPPSPRYVAAGATPGTAATAPPATFDAFTQAPPPAVAAAADWNAPPAGNPLRTVGAPAPTNPADPAAATSWNPEAPAVGTAAAPPTDPLGRLGAEFQNATAPIQEGVDQLGQQMRNAAESLDNRTGQMLDDLRGQSRALLGGSTGTPETETPATEWNPELAAARAASPAAAPSVGGSTNWNPEATDREVIGIAPAGTTAPVYVPPTATPPTAPPLVNSNGPAVTPGGSVGVGPTSFGIPPATAVDGDRWANSADPRFRTAGSGAPPASRDAPPSWPGAGVNDPAAPHSATVSGAFSVPGPGAGANAANRLASPAMPPAVLGDMLRLPGDRQLEGDAPTAHAAGGYPAPPISIVGNAGGQPPSSNWAAPANDAARGGSAQGSAPGSAPPQTQPSVANARDRAAVILAWVLLFASVAGNIYLFWSYLDVRTKYRSLVRKTARAVGSRFSAA